MLEFSSVSLPDLGVESSSVPTFVVPGTRTFVPWAPRLKTPRLGLPKPTASLPAVRLEAERPPTSTFQLRRGPAHVGFWTPSLDLAKK